MNRRGAVKAALVLVVAVNAMIVVVAMSRSDDDPVPVEPLAVAVTLLDPGNAPHEVLRFTPEVGSRMRTTMEMHGQSTVRAPGEPPTVIDLPMIEIRYTSRVTDIEADEISVEVTGSDFRSDVPNRVDDVSETRVVDDRGTVLQGALLTVPERQEVFGIVPARSEPAELYPFPVEPVGVGARWRTTTRFSGPEIAGREVAWDLVADIELVEIDDKRGVADVEYVVSMASGTHRLLLDDGSEVVSMDQTFVGTVTWYFDHPGSLHSGVETTQGTIITDLRGRQVTAEVEQRAEFHETRRRSAQLSSG